MKKYINAIILTGTIFINILFSAFYGKDMFIAYGDASGYFAYLPSALIYQNLKQPANPAPNQVFTLPENRIRGYLSAEVVTPKGYLIDQYTCGIAMMELPFFLIAHAYEKAVGLPADGLSASYFNMIRVATAFYAILGLYILFLCLKRFFNSTHSLISVCILSVGTNFLYFAFAQSGMAHIFIFFLVSALIYCTIKVYENPKMSYFILIGFILGFIILIRPTDIILSFIPLLYGVYNRQTLKDRLAFIYVQRVKIIVALFMIFIVMIPQLLYWKELTGHYLYYSYGNQEFNWKKPKIFEGIFSYKNGWLIYSPVMIFSVIGLIFFKRLKPFYLVLITTIPIYIYIIYSWYCYNYINGLGSRPMINIYPLLAFPLAASIHYLSNKDIVSKIVYTVLILFLSSVSIAYSIKQVTKKIWSENSTKTFNLHTLFKWRLDYNDVICFDNEIIQPNKNDLKYVTTLDKEDFENFESSNVVYDSTLQSKVYHLANSEYPEKQFKVPFDRTLFKQANWVKCSGRFKTTQYSGPHKNHVMVFQINRQDSIILWQPCIINNKIGLADADVPKDGFTLFDIRSNIWGEVYFYVPLPKDLKVGDDLRMIFWALDKRELFFDDIKMELYQE